MKYATALLVIFLAACGPKEPPRTGNTAAQSGSSGGSSCSAKSTSGKGCNIACQAGQSASCRDGSGTADATCTCTPAK